MKTYEQKVEQIKAILNDMYDDELVEIHNRYCEANNNYDDQIFQNDDATLNDVMGECTFAKAACKLYYSDYNYNDNYFWFDGYGNLESSNDPKDNIFVDDIARYIVDDKNDLDNMDLREVIQGWQEEDKDEEEEEP